VFLYDQSCSFPSLFSALSIIQCTVCVARRRPGVSDLSQETASHTTPTADIRYLHDSDRITTLGAEHVLTSRSYVYDTTNVG